MAKRILLAGVLGGVALFVWGGLSHMMLGLGQVGIKELPQEEYLLSNLRSSISQPGFYFFPGAGMRPGATAEEKKAAQAEFMRKYSSGPYGILIFHPEGTQPMSAGQLGRELGLNIVQALIAAWLLSFATGLSSFASRLGFVFGVGILAAITTNVEYWNWYGFPANYTGAYILDKLIGFLIVGLVVASLVKPATLRPPIVINKAA